MTWKLWTFTAFMVTEAGSTVLRTGRARQTRTPLQTIGDLAELAFLAWLVLS